MPRIGRVLVASMLCGTIVWGASGTAEARDVDTYVVVLGPGAADVRASAATLAHGNGGAVGVVYEEDDDISATVDELTGSPHVVVVREHDDESSPIIACGAIEGEAANGRLEIALDPVDDSGVSGTALFRPDDDDDDDDDDEPTEVLVRVSHGAAGETSGSPTATP